MEYTIVDVETTGLAGRDNRVTEIAVVVHNGERKIDEFHTLINPGIPISPFVTGLTGIDDNMVADAPAFGEIADTLLQMMENRVFVAHNVQFDYQVLRNEFRFLGHDFYRKKLCTVRWSRKVFPGLRSYSLGKLCASLEIDLQDRHRAKGDTDATVLLFEKLMQHDREEWFKTMVSRSSGMSSLPSLLPKSEFDKLPESPGVYYFKDANGQVIYVGKAINIKKRVLGHFYDKSSKEIALCRETASLDFEVTGSELIALLKESSEIKAIYPKYNRAQKRTNKGYAITAYKNRKGILQLAFNQAKMVSNPLKTFFSVNECMAALETLCESYELCPRYMQLQTGHGGCNHYKLNNCRGVCRGEEAVASYNERVERAIEQLTMEGESFVIALKGRTADEMGVVLIENGVYRGYGFIPHSSQVTRFEEFEDFIQREAHNSDVIKLVSQYLDKASNPKLIFKTPPE